MSLLSVDISKVNRLSLREVKLPTPELRVEPTPILTERPPTNEEIIYSKIVATNPLVEVLVNRLNLVSTTTGERINKVELKEDIKSEVAPEINKPKLIALAQTLISGEEIYSKEDIIERIKEATHVSRERAEIGFNLILQAGAIELTLGGRYYLKSSTPF
jgi:hypothetical protein